MAEESELGRSRKVTTKNSNSTKLISLTRCLASTNLVNLSYHTSRLRMAVRGQYNKGDNMSVLKQDEVHLWSVRFHFEDKANHLEFSEEEHNQVLLEHSMGNHILNLDYEYEYLGVHKRTCTVILG